MYKIVNFSMQVIIRVVLWHLQSSQVKQTPQDSINELISSDRFQIHLSIPECIMSCEFTHGVVMNFYETSFLNLMEMSSK